MQIQPAANITWQAREVIREVNGRPHVLVRVEVQGAYFPHRAVPAFVRVTGPEGRSMDSWFTEISEDNRRLLAYFPLDLPQRGRVEYGYAGQVLGAAAIEFETDKALKLDRARVPQDAVLTTSDDIPEWRKR